MTDEDVPAWVTDSAGSPEEDTQSDKRSGVSAEEYLSVLNPEQRAAVVHEGSGLLILAGAGSGKTRVVTTKIAYLISQKHIDPGAILAVTFTKKAAAEMQERAVHLEPRAAFAQIRTFHSFGAWFLRLYPEAAGVDKNFTVYDDDDMVTLVGKAVPELTRAQASAAAHKISLAKDYCLEPDSPDLIKLESDPEFPAVYTAYEKRLRETGNVDFGDLIMLPVLVLRREEQIRARMHYRFRVIMVDEYQDSNVAQFLLLQQLAGVEENAGIYVCVVGDDDQSIYKFRGAEVQNILTFQQKFPGTSVIRLERNYRSTSQILDAADSVVSHNEGRLGKTLVAERGSGKTPSLVFLPTQDDEAGFCAELVQQAKKRGCPYKDWAILYRTNAQSLTFETEFLHRKIPYTVVGSLKFYEREEIKDALAWLAFIANPRDEIAFRRIINKPARGIGATSQNKLVEAARALAAEYALSAGSPAVAAENTASAGRENSSSASGAPNIIDACRSAKLPKKAAEGLRSFVDLADELSSLLGGTSGGENTMSAADAGAGSENSGTDNKRPLSEHSDQSADTNMSGGENTQLPDSAAAHKKNVLSADVDTADSGTGASAGTHASGKAEKRSSKIRPADRDAASSAEPAAAALSAFIEKVNTRSGLLEYHTSQDEIAGTQRAANLQELENSAVLYPLSRAGLLDFLDHIELDRTLEKAEGGEEDNDSVTLITLHNTKGLEFPRVIITGLEAGIFPREDKTGDELEEERRLFYVGITRARDELYLTSCAVRRLYGRTNYMNPSPFLAELDKKNLTILGTAPAGFGMPRSKTQQASDGAAGGGQFLNTNMADDDGAYDNPLAAEWKLGTRLYHDDYGYGQVVRAAVDEDGEFVISVLFESGATKRFMPQYQAHSLMKVKE